MNRRTVFALPLVAASVLGGLGSPGPLGVGPIPAHPQSSNYPHRQPIKVVIPFPAGGPTDGIARIVSGRLGEVLGQGIIVENHGGGAGGSIGGKFVAGADPDGYTLLMTSGGPLTTGPAVHRNLGYDPAQLVPVCQLIETPNVMEVHPSLPVTTVAELVAYLRAAPGKVSWGSQGFGVATHLLLELFKLDTGVDVAHVPYRGSAPLLTAAVAGEVQVVIDPMTGSLPQIESGALRPIGIAGPARNRRLPNVPTMAEQGFRDIDSPFWLGVVAPAGTPPAVVTTLNAAFRDSLEAPEVRARLEALGVDIRTGTPDEFSAMLTQERALWIRVAKQSHITAE